MQVEIEFPYYAEFRVPGKRHPQREYLLGKAVFELRELDPATAKTACVIDLAWETGHDAEHDAVEDSLDKMLGRKPYPRPAGSITLIADGDDVYWPATSRHTGATLPVAIWLDEIQSQEAYGIAWREAHPSPNVFSYSRNLPAFDKLLDLNHALKSGWQGPNKGVLCGKPRPRTAEEAGVREFIADNRDLCQAAIAEKISELAVHDGLIVRNRGEPMYHVSYFLADGVKLKVVAQNELDDSRANLGPFPNSQLIRIDRYADAVRIMEKMRGRVPDIKAVELVDWQPVADPVTIMVEDQSRSLNSTFQHLRERDMRWRQVPADLRAKIDGMFPQDRDHLSGDTDVFAVMDLLEDCDRRLHQIYWDRPDQNARRPARDLMEFTQALRTRLADDTANGVITRPEPHQELTLSPTP